MAQETNDGVDYLKTLKQSSFLDTATGAPPAREAQNAQQPGEAGPDSRDRYQGTEKRRSLRYKCEGSAELREDGRDVRTWATFSDVSLHGCYVEAQATYPVGTVLYMKLEANGVRVESKGNVRVTYPYLGMGIAFKEMSGENVARLRELLSKISRPAIIMGPGIASSLPSTGPLDVPLIANPTAALEALTEFFENRQMLMREDFLRILRKSQSPETKP